MKRLTGWTVGVCFVFVFVLVWQGTPEETSEQQKHTNKTNQMAAWNEMSTVSNQKQIVTLFQAILQFCELNSSPM